MKRSAHKVFDLFHEPAFLTKFHGWAAIVWFIAAFPIMIWWSESVQFIVFISVYAVVGAHWSSWQASRVEEKQDAADHDGNLDT